MRGTKTISRSLVIASRGSKLALTQTEMVATMLRRVHPDLEVEILTVTTKGDIDKRPFAEIGGKGLFMSEVEAAVVGGEADIAVHSAKDLTAELAEGCALLAIPAREDPRDVVVGGSGASGEERLGTLTSGSLVGTSSMRRKALLGESRPDLQVVELRGNLDTRLRKVVGGEVDVAILAAAGIARLGADADAAPIGPDHWVPAPGQGFLAIEGRADRDDLRQLLAGIDDPASRAALEAERAFSARLEGGCSVPLGCLASPAPAGLVLTGYLALPDGSRALRDRISGPLSHAVSMGTELAEAIIGGGGDEILEELKWDSTDAG